MKVLQRGKEMMGDKIKKVVKWERNEIICLIMSFLVIVTAIVGIKISLILSFLGLILGTYGIVISLKQRKVHYEETKE